jgi:glycosyltransferase involved in cell wall biosynthesis
MLLWKQRVQLWKIPLNSYKMDLTIVLPVYNEEGNIQGLFKRTKSILDELGLTYEILFINDGSSDNSLKIIRELVQDNQPVSFIDFSRNFGHQIALTAGLDHAKGDAIVIMDSDLQDPPEVIKDLYRKYKEGYEVVYARRRSRHGENFLKKLTARWFYRLLQKITSFEIPIDTGDFRILDKKVAMIIRQMPEYSKFVRGMIAWVGFRQTYIEYDRGERKSGSTGYPLRKMVRLALDGITAFSDLPLRIATFLGFIVSIVSFIILLYTLYIRLIEERAIVGWASTITSILFLGGIQLICIGIIGEYISRINTQVKNRPPYVIREKNF